MRDLEYERQFYARAKRPEEVRQLTNHLKNLDLRTISDSDLHDLIWKKHGGLPFDDTIIPVGSKLYRARIVEGTMFDKLSDLEMPPAERITRYGRANLPHHQIFYSASNFELAIMEVIQNLSYLENNFQKTIWVVVSEWETIAQLHMAQISNNSHLHSIRSDIKKHHDKVQIMMKKGGAPDWFIEATQLLTAFLADEFMKSPIKYPEEYKITAVFSKMIQFMNSTIREELRYEEFDGINYPSPASRFIGDNQAIFPDSFKRKIKFLNAVQVICYNLNKSQCTFTSGVLHDVKSVIDGRITWNSEIYQENH